MIVRIVPVVSKKNVQTTGKIIWKRYPDDRKRPGRLRRPRSLDRIEFYPDDRGDRVNFESPGSFAIVWVAFPYDRPDRLNIFRDGWDDPDDPDDYMETRLKRSPMLIKHILYIQVKEFNN